MNEEDFFNRFLHHVVVLSNDFSLVTHRLFFDEKKSNDFFIKCMESGFQGFWYKTRFIHPSDFYKRYVELELNYDYD